MYSNILVPVALDHDHKPIPALKVASTLLSKGGLITALHVMEDLPGYVTQYLPEGQRTHQLEDARAGLKAEVGDWPHITVEVILGHSGRTILDYAERHDTDCIVITSHRPGLQDYFLGSTAARIVRHAQCAVHVIR